MNEVNFLLQRLEEAEEQTLVEVVCQSASAVLGRVLGLVHRDECEFSPLVECQPKARDLQLALAETQWRDLPADAEVLADGKHIFSALLALIGQQEQLDDDQRAAL